MFLKHHKLIINTIFGGMKVPFCYKNSPNGLHAETFIYFISPTNYISAVSHTTRNKSLSGISAAIQLLIFESRKCMFSINTSINHLMEFFEIYTIPIFEACKCIFCINTSHFAICLVY